MHEITSCSKGEKGMKNADAAWFMHFHILTLKVWGLHKCLQSKVCLQRMCLCQGVCRGQCYLLPASCKSAWNLHNTAVRKHEPQWFIKAVAWKSTSSSFLPSFFFFFPPLKNVTKPQWLSSPVIEILTKTSSHICDSKTGSMLHNSGPLMAWFAYTANAYSFFTCFWSLENKHLSIAVGICSESSIFCPFFDIWRLCYRLLLQE